MLATESSVGLRKEQQVSVMSALERLYSSTLKNEQIMMVSSSR